MDFPDPLQQLQKPKLYADMFTFGSFLLFGYHFVTIWYLSVDPDVVYFIGQWQLLGLFWMPLLIIIHVIHARHGTPWRALMMWCVLPACATFFIIGWGLLFKAERLSMLLRSPECTRAPMTEALHAADVAARQFHKECLVESAPEYKLIQFCYGYEDALNENENNKAGWEYLSLVEHNYGCAGFCNPEQEPAMWTFQGYEDTCAVAIANAFQSKVASLCYQQLFVAVLEAVLFLIWIELMVPTLKAIERGEAIDENEPFAKTPGRSSNNDSPRAYPYPRGPAAAAAAVPLVAPASGRHGASGSASPAGVYPPPPPAQPGQNSIHGSHASLTPPPPPGPPVGATMLPGARSDSFPAETPVGATIIQRSPSHASQSPLAFGRSPSNAGSNMMQRSLSQASQSPPRPALGRSPSHAGSNIMQRSASHASQSPPPRPPLGTYPSQSTLPPVVEAPVGASIMQRSPSNSPVAATQVQRSLSHSSLGPPPPPPQGASAGATMVA